MKHSKKLALMFMTSFIGSVLVMVLFALYALNGSVLDRALVKSEYVALVHQELLVSASQSVSAYGLRSDVMDVIFTEERVHENIMRNLKGLESLDLKMDMMDELHAEIDRMNLTFTQDVEKGMLELSDKLMGNFKQCTRFPLQGTILGLIERLIPLLWGLGFILFIMMILFIGQARKLARREQNTVILSILGSWLVLLGLWGMYDLKSLVFEPVSLKNLILAIHRLVFRDGFVLAGILVTLFGIRWYHLKVK